MPGSLSLSANVAVRFDYDVWRGTLYHRDPSRGKKPILDDLPIYGVDDIENLDDSAPDEGFWCGDAMKAEVSLYEGPEAVFDLESRRA